MEKAMKRLHAQYGPWTDREFSLVHDGYRNGFQAAVELAERKVSKDGPSTPPD